MKVEKNLDPTSLVARIIAELQASPEAQQLLLRALLTNEFLGVPARLDRIEKDVAELKVDVAQLKTDVAQLKTDVAQLKTDVAQLKTDVAEVKTDVAQLKTDVAEVKTTVDVLQIDIAWLKGSDLENRLHRKIGPLLSQALGLKRLAIVQAPVQIPASDFRDEIEDAVDDGRITARQLARLNDTDAILHAQHRADRTPVWIAVEASHTVHGGDINRARASADALQAVFRTEAMAVATGYRISAANAERAKAAGVEYLEVSPPRRA